MLAVHTNNTTISDSSTDLDGASIGVCGGCVQERYLDKDLKLPAVECDFVIDHADIRPYENNLAAFTDLALGDGVRLDAVLATSSNICTQIQDGAPVKYVPDRAVLFSEANGLVFDGSSSLDSTSLRERGRPHNRRDVRRWDSLRPVDEVEQLGQHEAGRFPGGDAPDRRAFCRVRTRPGSRDKAGNSDPASFRSGRR